MLALIGNLDTAELLIVMLAAVLVFGKKLPQVAAQAGSQLVKLRRSLDQAWRDTGMDREIGGVKRDLESAIPRDLSLGDMARIASSEMEKRMRANEEELAKEAQVASPAEAKDAAPPAGEVATPAEPPAAPSTATPPATPAGPPREDRSEEPARAP